MAALVFFKNSFSSFFSAFNLQKALRLSSFSSSRCSSPLSCSSSSSSVVRVLDPRCSLFVTSRHPPQISSIIFSLRSFSATPVARNQKTSEDRAEPNSSTILESSLSNPQLNGPEAQFGNLPQYLSDSVSVRGILSATQHHAEGSGSGPLAKAFLEERLPYAMNTNHVNVLAATIASAKPSSAHVAMIDSILEHMDKNKIATNLDTYTALFSIFPQDRRFGTKTFLDAVWPRETLQSACAMKMLGRMENEWVIADLALYNVMLRVFGKAAQPVQRIRRLTYWQKRLAYNNPYSLATPPKLDIEIAMQAIRRLAGRIGEGKIEENDEEIQVLQERESCLFSFTPLHNHSLLESDQQMSESRLSILGPQYFWFQKREQAYFVLVREDASEEREATPLAVALNAGHPSGFSAQRWISLVQARFPALRLANMSINLSSSRINSSPNKKEAEEYDDPSQRT